MSEYEKRFSKIRFSVLKEQPERGRQGMSFRSSSLINQIPLMLRESTFSRDSVSQNSPLKK